MTSGDTGADYPKRTRFRHTVRTRVKNRRYLFVRFAEFATLVAYLQPDIGLGCESCTHETELFFLLFHSFCTPSINDGLSPAIRILTRHGDIILPGNGGISVIYTSSYY